MIADSSKQHVYVKSDELDKLHAEFDELDKLYAELGKLHKLNSKFDGFDELDK